MLSFEDLTTLEPEQVWLRCSLGDREDAWQQSQKQAYANAAARWNAYQNYLCWKTVGTWLETELETEPNSRDRLKVWPQLGELPTFWEVIPGTACTIGTTRLLLLPESTLNYNELRVPQEWVDIPDWAAHYYLAVQADPEQEWLNIVGYATHHQLKTQGEVDAMDRTYCLGRESLIEDLDVMWIARELAPAPVLDVAPLSPLNDEVAEELLERLGQPSPCSPRLDAPFDRWAALMANPHWRRQLYQRRTAAVSNAVPTPLQKQWIQWQTLVQEAIASAGEALEGLVNSPSLAPVPRGDAAQIAPMPVMLGDARVILVLVSELKGDREVCFYIRVQPENSNSVLPPQLELSAFDELEDNSQRVRSDETSREIELPPLLIDRGERFSVRITLGDYQYVRDIEVN